MIVAFKNFAKRYWPALHLRTILMGTLLFTAALPGAGALFLRVYENTLVRQSEAELVAQGAALVAAAEVDWPGGEQGAIAGEYRPEPSSIDLRTSPVLGERPSGVQTATPAEPDAVTMASRVGPVVDRTAITTLASIQLLDRHGIVVHGYEKGTSYVGVPEVAAALSGQTRTVFRRSAAYRPVYSFEWLSRASALRLHHVRPIVYGNQVVGAVLLSRSPRALFRGLYEDRGKILLGVALIFGTLVVLTGLLSRGIVRPIETLTGATRELASGRGTVPDTPVTAAIEIRALFDNFRTMAAAIAARSAYLRDFAASMAHEFKTPLAGIKGSVELLQDHGDMVEADRARFLGNIGSDADRLSQLVSRLMDLARADMADASGESCDADAVARRLADAFTTPAFAVTVDGPSPCPVPLSEATLEAVLSMLLDNARQAGATHVTATFGHSQITVEDNGPGVAPGDRDRLFEPFFTTRRASGGTGLGLSIARSLLASAGASIDYQDRPQGAAFIVRFR